MSELNDCDTALNPKGAPNPLEDREHDNALWAKKITEVPTNMQGRWVYDANNNCIYAAYAVKGLPEATAGWLLQKYTYDANNNCTSRLIAYDSFNNYLTASYE